MKKITNIVPKDYLEERTTRARHMTAAVCALHNRGEIPKGVQAHFETIQAFNRFFNNLSQQSEAAWVNRMELVVGQLDQLIQQDPAEHAEKIQQLLAATESLHRIIMGTS